LDDSLKELQIRAVDAKSGSGEAAKAFKALGLKTTNAAGQMREPLKVLPSSMKIPPFCVRPLLL